MYQRLLLSWLCLLTFRCVSAQIITTDPAFPTEADQVTIYFDATQGNGGLKDCNCTIYLHTGVITDQSNSDWRYVKTVWGQANADWKLQPVAGQPNVYSYVIGPSIREYYQVPAGETIQQLAFVFRNADGTKEGKGNGNTDIFVPVYDESLQINLVSPANEISLVAPGEDILVQAQTNLPATLSIFRDGNLITQVTEATAINYTFEADNDPHFVEIRAEAGTEQLSRHLVYLVSDLQPVQAVPANFPDGRTELGPTSAHFQLHAPSNEVVFLLGDFNDWQPAVANLMNRAADGTFWLQIDQLVPGQTYTYQYLVDDGTRVADPLSTLVLDPENDPYVPEVTFPDLPDYPLDDTQGIVSVFTQAAPDYNWKTEDFQAPPKEELVIYELLMRDFLARHDYQTLLDTLDYLEGLGVNAIQLLPVSEFEGNDSWGYNPSFHMALDKYYGTPGAFKALIDECHSRGIAVILDVVYNHAFSQSPLARLDWDAPNFRPSPTNPWLNVEARHPFNVGYDFNHQSPATQRYVDRVMRYWLTAFRVDGFRFDLSKGFTQRQTTDINFWGSYDPNRVAVLKHYADVMWSVNPSAYVILEHFAENSEEIELTDYGMMSWAGGGVHNQYLEGAMGYSSDLSGAAYTARNWNNPHLIAYMESHDEERMVYKNVQFGNSNGNYKVMAYPTAIRRAELAATFFYTIPGPKMLWQFGELGYDYSINTCTDGSVHDDCRLAPKPIRWDYLQDPNRKRLYDVVSGLIHLKTHYEVFNTTDFTLDVGSNTYAKKIFLNGTGMDVVVQGNFDVQTRNLSSPFSHSGWWYDYFTGDSIFVADATPAIALEPGAYHLYTSVKLGGPPNGFPTPVVERLNGLFRLKASPNPVAGPLNVAYVLPETAPVQLDLFDDLGRPVRQLFSGREAGGEHLKSFDLALPAGVFYLQLQAGLRKETITVLIH